MKDFFIVLEYYGVHMVINYVSANYFHSFKNICCEEQVVKFLFLNFWNCIYVPMYTIEPVTLMYSK